MTQAEARAADWARERVGNGYIWGATGWVCSKARREQQARQYPGQADMILGVGAKWDGKVCWDCATFVRGAAKAGGVSLCSGATSQWNKTDWADKGAIDTLPRDQVVMLYRQSGGAMQHTGVYTGDGNCIHAKGTRYGVVRQSVDSYKWTHWARPAWAETNNAKGGDDMGETLVVTSEDGNPVKMRREPKTDADVLCKVSAGLQVTRTSDDGTWSAIEYGGVHGYMMSKFLSAASDQGAVTRAEFDALASRVAALEARA